MTRQDCSRSYRLVTVVILHTWLSHGHRRKHWETAEDTHHQMLPHRSIFLPICMMAPHLISTLLTPSSPVHDGLKFAHVVGQLFVYNCDVNIGDIKCSPVSPPLRIVLLPVWCSLVCSLNIKCPDHETNQGVVEGVTARRPIEVLTFLLIPQVGSTYGKCSLQ